VSTKQIIDTYIAAWNETDEAKRVALIEECWDAGATYTDPTADVSGREALAGLIAGFQQQMPGASIAVASGIDEHHGRIRFGWRLLADDGSTRMEGIDVGQLAPDGRLESIVGFWGATPPAAG
jgi:hypothetical protein